MFAALNTVEPPIVEREIAMLTESKESWYQQRLQAIDGRVQDRLRSLSEHLGTADWLDGPFSAGDLLMVLVLRRLEGTGIVDGHANLAAYVARGEARPAYRRAFAAQRAVFDAASSG